MIANWTKHDGTPQFQWINPSQAISKAREDELIREKAKRPRHDTAILHAALYSEVLEDRCGDPNSSLWWREFQELMRNSMALCRHCHLGSVKLFDNSFNNAAEADPPPGLRRPSGSERVAVHQQLWQAIFKLVNESHGTALKWTLDDAIYEFTVVRPDLANKLQARPKSASEMNQGWQGKGDQGKARPDWRDSNRQKGKGNPKGKGKDVPKGKGKDGGKGGKNTPLGWNPNWSMESVGDNEGIPHGSKLCRRFHTAKCAGEAAGCRYVHACPVRLADGNTCNKNHKATNHK